MDEYITELDRDRTITDGYSAPETMNSYSYRLRALCRWMVQKKGFKTTLAALRQYLNADEEKLTEAMGIMGKGVSEED